ncbi:MAG: malate synthase A, partial [Burkholderiaceae bacterium]|nr:malate synthase A [Burkholderiaceae bacterium]
MSFPQGVEVRAAIKPGFEKILTHDALALVAKLQRSFNARRQELLADRVARAKRLDAGEKLDFLAATQQVRSSDWKIAPLPKDLLCRRVEITGPVERKMIINALNSGADAYMTDFEDSNAPNWDNQITGQINLIEAVRRTITLQQGEKTYRLNDKVATLLVRP